MSMSIKNLGLALAVLAVPAMMLAGGEASADTQRSANLDVSATVPNSCSIGTSALAFNTYDPIGANASADKEGTGSVSVTCTTGAVVHILLAQGTTPEGTSTISAPKRQMLGSAHGQALKYSIFQNSNHTTVWGGDTDSGVASGTTALAASNGAAQTATVYGLIPQAQNVPADSYSDTILATVSF